jgi:hypothetical protein
VKGFEEKFPIAKVPNGDVKPMHTSQLNPTNNE